MSLYLILHYCKRIFHQCQMLLPCRRDIRSPSDPSSNHRAFRSKDCSLKADRTVKAITSQYKGKRNVSQQNFHTSQVFTSHFETVASVIPLLSHSKLCSHFTFVTVHVLLLTDVYLLSSELIPRFISNRVLQ
jgi:hypothetical protein